MTNYTIQKLLQQTLHNCFLPFLPPLVCCDNFCIFVRLFDKPNNLNRLNQISKNTIFICITLNDINDNEVKDIGFITGSNPDTSTNITIVSGVFIFGIYYNVCGESRT